MSTKNQQGPSYPVSNFLSTSTYTTGDFVSVGVTFLGVLAAMAVFLNMLLNMAKPTEITGSVFYWGMFSFCAAVGVFAVVVVITCIIGFFKPKKTTATPKAEIVFSDSEFKEAKGSKHA